MVCGTTTVSSGLFLAMLEQVQRTVAWVQQKFNLKYKQNIHHLHRLDFVILTLLIFINSCLLCLMGLELIMLLQLL